jgi:putative redox protein
MKRELKPMPVTIEGMIQEPYRQVIQAGKHTFFADVTPEKGGQDTAPDPHQLLFGAWGACTAITIQMYAQRKGWPLESVSVSFDEERESGKTPIVRKNMRIAGNLTEEQIEALKSVAEKCPVNQLITGEKQVIKDFSVASLKQ